MGTLRQKALAKNLVENTYIDNPLNKTQILTKSGYSPTSADRSSTDLINRPGVKEELALLGFTEDNAKKVVSQILNNEDEESNTRLKAADMTFKIHGSYAPEKKLNVNVNMEISEEDRLLAEKLKNIERDNTTES